jgi:hypothetical protein
LRLDRLRRDRRRRRNGRSGHGVETSLKGWVNRTAEKLGNAEIAVEIEALKQRVASSRVHLLRQFSHSTIS